MPRKTRDFIPRRALPLASASDRQKLLEKAGQTADKLAALLGKTVAVVEGILDDPKADPFARIAAAKMLARDIIAIAPSKVTGGERAPQQPVTIVFPDWVGPAPRLPAPKPVAARVLPHAPQVPADPGI